MTTLPPHVKAAAKRILHKSHPYCRVRKDCCDEVPEEWLRLAQIAFKAGYRRALSDLTRGRVGA